MNVELAIQFQLGNSPQVFFQNGSFDPELMFVVGVLIVASATALEVRTPRSIAPRRGSDNFFQTGPRKPRLLFT